MDRKCKNCMSWQRDSGDGICRRKAPQPGIVVKPPVRVEKNKVVPPDYILIWPRTNSEDWCMQFVEEFVAVEKKN